MALALRVAFVVVVLGFLMATARMLEAKITWYLAVDQFGYLQFAHDLLQGKVFHDWQPARLLRALLPVPTDLLSQTYVWDGEKMYCRYAPGFPMLVAAWMALFGDMRVHYLNTAVYLSLLCVVIAVAWRLTGSAWRGLAVAALVVLCPTLMYLWALTLTRDLSAHLFAFSGLFLLLPYRGRPLSARRLVGAGVLLGFAGSIRNDAVLYLVPATLIVARRWWLARPPRSAMLRAVGAAALGMTIGLFPTLAFNAIATGNPFRPTQGMELQQFLPGSEPKITIGQERTGYPPLWRGGTSAQVQGGGLKLSNLPRTIVAYRNQLSGEYGPVLLGLAGLGAVLAAFQRPYLFLAAVPYCIVAILFYSCWIRPDHRYIIGVYTFLPFLIVEGTCGSVELVRRLARRFGDGTGRAVAGGLAVAGIVVAVVSFASPPPTRTALSVLGWLLPGALGAGAIAAAASPRRRVTAIMAPILAIALAGYAIARGEQSLTQRAAFQKPEMLAARATFAKAVEAGSVVITSEEIGRPAENIEYYSGVATAMYLTDLERWQIPASTIALTLIASGVRPYLLIDEGVTEEDVSKRARLLADLNSYGMKTELLEKIPQNRKMAYFVAAPGPPRQRPGERNPVPAELYRISHPEAERLINDAKARRQSTGSRP